MLEAVISGFAGYADFSGTTTRADYWWFFLFLLLLSALCALISSTLYLMVSLVITLPLLAVGTRRLNHTGRNGGWQLLALVPFGVFVLLYLLAQPGPQE